MMERQVQLELEEFMLRHGAQGLAFPSIVATGPNGASPHAIPGATMLEAGQCVVLDFGARSYGYCSDMTRTVFLGEPDPEMRAAWDALREANESVEAMLRPGVTGKEGHEQAEAVPVSYTHLADSLSAEELAQVDAFAQQIDIANSQQVLTFGAGAQKKMASFSETALAKVRTQDLGEAGDLIAGVVTELKNFDVDDDDKGFFGLFKKSANKITSLKARYDTEMCIRDRARGQRARVFRMDFMDMRQRRASSHRCPLPQARLAHRPSSA